MFIFDNVLRASYTSDLINTIFNGSPFVYWGFTSSTGGFFNDQRVFINSSLSTYALTDKTTCTDPEVVELPSLGKYIGKNLSLGKPAFSSSDEHGGVLPAEAVDGDAGSRWSSAAADPQWMYIDLVTITDIDSVVLYWETAYGRQYIIQVSNDAVTWTDMYTETNSDGGKDKIIFSATNVRYVRMYGTQRATGYGYSIYEFQVYGKLKYVWAPNDGSISDIYSAMPTFTPTVTTAYTVTIPDLCTGSVVYNMTITVDCTTLPVSFLSFDASTIDAHNHLSWNTILETDVDYFTILKSNDGIHFYAIGNVIANNKNKDVSMYSFIDPSISEGIVYYQIVSNGFGNVQEKSVVKMVSNYSDKIILLNAVFQNETTLRFSNAEWVSVKVVDMLGRTVLTIKEDKGASEVVFGSTLDPAMYLVYVETLSAIEVFKIIKT